MQPRMATGLFGRPDMIEEGDKIVLEEAEEGLDVPGWRSVREGCVKGGAPGYCEHVLVVHARVKRWKGGIRISRVSL